MSATIISKKLCGTDMDFKEFDRLTYKRKVEWLKTQPPPNNPIRKEFKNSNIPYIREFVNFIHPKELRNYTGEDFLKYLFYKWKSGVKRETIKSCVKVFNSFFVSNDIKTFNSFDFEYEIYLKFLNFSTEKKFPTFKHEHLEFDDFLFILNDIKNSKIYIKKDRYILIFLLLYFGEMCLKDIHLLNISDVSFKGDTVFISVARKVRSPHYRLNRRTIRFDKVDSDFCIYTRMKNYLSTKHLTNKSLINKEGVFGFKNLNFCNETLLSLISKYRKKLGKNITTISFNLGYLYELREAGKTMEFIEKNSSLKKQFITLFFKELDEKRRIAEERRKRDNPEHDSLGFLL